MRPQRPDRRVNRGDGRTKFVDRQVTTEPVVAIDFGWIAYEFEHCRRHGIPHGRNTERQLSQPRVTPAKRPMPTS